MSNRSPTCVGSLLPEKLCRKPVRCCAEHPHIRAARAVWRGKELGWRLLCKECGSKIHLQR